MQSFKGKHKGPVPGFSGGVGRRGEKIPVVVKGFLTPENGDIFYTCMKGIYRSFISPFWSELGKLGKNPENLSNFLVRQQVNGDFELIVNFRIQPEALVRTNVSKGDPVSYSQIADIRRITLPDVNISARETIVFFFTHYWRHVLYFDFGCVNDKNYNLSLEDLEKNLAQCYLDLWFPTYFREDDVTTRLRESGWFSFIALGGQLYEQIYSVFKNEENPESKEWVVVDKMDAQKFRNLSDHWYNKDAIASRKEFFDTAIERFEAGDFISCIKILYPEIEGVLRELYLPQSGQPGFKDLIKRLKNEVESHAPIWSLFRQDEFLEYLTKWFFKGFDYSSGNVDLARHSSAHGVAASSEYSKRNAVIGFLILDQISFFLKTLPSTSRQQN